jgi:AAA ATPase domain
VFSLEKLNGQQKRILASWPQLLWNFARREWISVFVSSGAGVLAAEIFHLLWRDRSFQLGLSTKYKPGWVNFDDPRYYTFYILAILVLVLLAVGPFLSINIWRGIKSWLHGVTSGLVLLPFTTAFSLSLLPEPTLERRLILGFGLIVTWFLAGFILYIRANSYAARTIAEEEFRVSQSVRSTAGSQLEWSDDPIQTWTQDVLGRAALVDILSVKIMIGKAPVIALSGPFGVGKTSVLNLLREHLGDKTITVSFSTWLPGSQDALTSYLLADIANECKKQYLVPGLRQSATRLATAMGQKVPIISEYLKLLPPDTQRDSIENLKSALVRLPKRVVVLLDEIDRMEKEELMTLLKVIRGVATLPNLSFICAGSIPSMVDIAKKDEEYFDKFFPVVIPVPEPDPAELRRTGPDRLATAFVSRDWFQNDTERAEFKERVESLWNARIAPFCKTLRAVGLLANDVSVAAASLWREVDPSDLTLVEILHRFRPSIYRLVAKNSLALTGGQSVFRGGTYHDDKDEKAARSKFFSNLEEILSGGDESEAVRGVIDELFPSQRRAERTRKAEDSAGEIDKRIREPGIFPAYFRYDLPDEIFSFVELDSLLRRFDSAQGQSARDGIFLDTLHSMEKGSLKRDDFLRKLAESAKSLSGSTGHDLGISAVKASDQYTYDLFPGFGEAGHVLRLILAIAQKLSRPERVTFLQKCIRVAADDTMAVRVLTILPVQKTDTNLDIQEADLYPSFTERMRTRYGRDVDAAEIDLTTADPRAFNVWGMTAFGGVPSDPEDRNIQADFWRRYIGDSRSRLAQAFRQFFLPGAVIYETDPAPYVEYSIPISDLTRLYKDLPPDAALTDWDQQSLAVLERFLNGEFKNGIGPMSKLYD